MVHAIPDSLVQPNHQEFNLIAPFTSPENATGRKWLNLKTGEPTRIQIYDAEGGNDASAITVKSYSDLCTNVLSSSEPKYIGEDDKYPGDSSTIGPLHPITIRAKCILSVGKESSVREDVQASFLNPLLAEQNVYQRDDWDKLKPMLNAIPTRTLSHALDIDQKTIYRWRKGTRPAAETLEKLIPHLLEHLRQRFPDTSPLSDRELLDWEGLDARVTQLTQETPGHQHRSTPVTPVLPPDPQPQPNRTATGAARPTATGAPTGTPPCPPPCPPTCPTLQKSTAPEAETHAQRSRPAQRGTRNDTAPRSQAHQPSDAKVVALR